MSTADPKSLAEGSVDESERDLFAEEEGAEEPAEAKWLLARESDPDAPAPSAEVAAEHEELANMLAELPVGTDDDSWHDEVLRKLAAESSPRTGAAAASTAASPEAVAKAIDASSNVVSIAWWRRPLATWAGGGAVAAAAAIFLWTRLAPEPPDRAELAYETFHDEAARVRTKEVAVGDRLVVKANPRGTGDLRVFREDGTLVARCPDEPRCAAKPDGELVLDVTLDAPVQYRIILVVGAKAGTLDPSGDSSMNAYLEAARAANARIEILSPLQVH
jgi:hypothetical protein